MYLQIIGFRKILSMEVKALNPKYVEMLQKSYKKFKTIEVIDNTKNPDKFKLNHNQVKNIKEGTKKTIGMKSKPKLSFKKSQAHRKVHERRMFSPEEDKILLEAIMHETDIKIPHLASSLNRSFKSISDRIKKLQRSSSLKSNRFYTLSEDISIVDVAYKHVFQSKSCEVPQNNFKVLLTV